MSNFINISGSRFGNVSGVTIINGKVVGGNAGGGKSVKGNGELGTEKRSLDQDFDQVQISNGIKANIEVGKPNDGVNLSGDSNLLSEVETRVVDGKLVIAPKEGVNIDPKNPLQATFYMSDLTGIQSSTSAAVVATGLAAGRLKMDASTSSSIQVSGTADRVKAEASTSGAVVANDLVAREVSADASTSGSISVRATEELQADASTGASVYYFGDPSVVDKDTSTGGSVRGL
jgi:Putative auto-transporter adhesin, head GIN domain